MEILKRFQKLVTDLNSTNGRIQKEGFLAQFIDDDQVKTVLNFLYNPFIVSGVNTKKLSKFRDIEDLPLLRAANAEASPCDFLQLINYFTHNTTGRDEDLVYLVSSAKHISGGDDGLLELIYQTITKNLKTGVAYTTLNKVFGEGFIPKFEVMLAFPYADNETYVESKKFILTEKLDGVRCVLIFDESGTPNFFSRQGKPFEKLTELAREALKLDKNFVYDGELLLSNNEGLDSKDLYRATVKVANCDGEKFGLVFNVFDKVRKTDFMKGVSETPCEERKNSLASEVATLKLSNIKSVDLLYVGMDTEKISSFLKKMCDKGGEGVMINIADAPYECKRTKNLLKVKAFKTADVKVLRVEEGSSKNRGKLGSVYVQFFGPDNKLYECKVGSGFSDEEREQYWREPQKILGKIIEIGYFELSQNQKDSNYSLRFPTFKHVRDDKNEISMN